MTIRDLPKARMTTRPGVRGDISSKALQRWNPDVRSAADDDAGSISILDVIGEDMFGDGMTARRIAAALRQIGDRPVVVNINSPGGDFFEGLAIYNTLREHPQTVTVNVLGLAASAASVIAMSADHLKVARAGFLMIHNAWVLAIGDKQELREVADWLEPFDSAAADIYAARTGADKESITAMLNRETWIGGEAAVEQGFADALLDSDEATYAPSNSSGASVRAERKFDIMAAKAGMTRSAGRELLQSLKGSTPGAAPTNGTPGAADATEGLQQLLAKMKSI